MPSVLLAPTWVTTANMAWTVIADKFVTAAQLCAGKSRGCKAAGISCDQELRDPTRERSGDHERGRRRPARHRGPGAVRPSQPAGRPPARGPLLRCAASARTWPGAGAHRTSTSTSRPARSPRWSGTTGRASDPDQDHLRHLGAGRAARSSGRAGRSACTPEGRRRPRDRHRLPGPRLCRQPGHRAEHVPRPRAGQALGCWTRSTMEKQAKRTLGRLSGDHGPLGPAAGRLAVRRAAPGGRGGQGRDAATPSW